MKITIPMFGMSSRFSTAGYTINKDKKFLTNNLKEFFTKLESLTWLLKK